MIVTRRRSMLALRLARCLEAVLLSRITFMHLPPFSVDFLALFYPHTMTCGCVEFEALRRFTTRRVTSAPGECVLAVYASSFLALETDTFQVSPSARFLLA